MKVHEISGAAKCSMVRRIRAAAQQNNFFIASLRTACIFAFLSVHTHVEDARLRSVRRPRHAMHVLANPRLGFSPARRPRIDVFTRTFQLWGKLFRKVFEQY